MLQFELKFGECLFPQLLDKVEPAPPKISPTNPVPKNKIVDLNHHRTDGIGPGQCGLSGSPDLIRQRSVP